MATWMAHFLTLLGVDNKLLETDVCTFCFNNVRPGLQCSLNLKWQSYQHSWSPVYTITLFGKIYCCASYSLITNISVVIRAVTWRLENRWLEPQLEQSLKLGLLVVAWYKALYKVWITGCPYNVIWDDVIWIVIHCTKLITRTHTTCTHTTRMHIIHTHTTHTRIICMHSTCIQIDERDVKPPPPQHPFDSMFYPEIQLIECEWLYCISLVWIELLEIYQYIHIAKLPLLHYYSINDKWLKLVILVSVIFGLIDILSENKTITGIHCVLYVRCSIH